MLVYTVMQTAGSRYLSLSQALKLKGLTALPPRRSPLVLRLFALALADGSGLPFSLHPPPAALESQTPQREPRRLRRRPQNCQSVSQTLFSSSHACGVTTPLCKGRREKRRRGSKFRAYKKRTPEKGVRFFLNSSHHDANIPNLYLIRRSFAPQSSARSHKNTTVETP